MYYNEAKFVDGCGSMSKKCWNGYDVITAKLLSKHAQSNRAWHTVVVCDADWTSNYSGTIDGNILSLSFSFIWCNIVCCYLIQYIMVFG